MSEILSAVTVLALLCASTGIGLFIRLRLPQHHYTRETTELMQLTIGLLGTFAAIVLGLLTASVKQDYDSAAFDRQHYALQLTSLDACLHDYGPGAAAIRAEIHSYTAAVIASTWPNEPPPTGVSYPDTSHMPRVGASPVLGGLMERIGVAVTDLAPADPRQTKIAALCQDRYKDISNDRLSVIEDARRHLSNPFYEILVIWMMIMFACFGLVTPRNGLSITTIGLCAISMSSVIFVIVDLSQPYGGFFSISSATMRDALTAMLAAPS